jgi:hypothetical protein
VVKNGQELPDASTPVGAPDMDPELAPELAGPAGADAGALVAAAPASPVAPRGSETPSVEGEPRASAASGSQKIVTTPSAVRRINVVVTTAEVRSERAIGDAGEDGLALGFAAIGRSINTS